MGTNLIRMIEATAHATPKTAKAGNSKNDSISWPASVNAGKSPKYKREITVPIIAATATGAKAVNA